MFLKNKRQKCESPVQRPDLTQRKVVTVWILTLAAGEGSSAETISSVDASIMGTQEASWVSLVA